MFPNGIAGRQWVTVRVQEAHFRNSAKWKNAVDLHASLAIVSLSYVRYSFRSNELPELIGRILLTENDAEGSMDESIPRNLSDGEQKVSKHK